MKPGSAGGECAGQTAGRPQGGGHLDAAGVRAERSAARAAESAGDGGADARGARGLSLSSQSRRQPRRTTPRAQAFGEAYKNDLALERQFFARRRAAARRTRPDRQRRRNPRLRRPARARAAGRGRLHAARGDPRSARSTARLISASRTASARSRPARTPIWS